MALIGDLVLQTANAPGTGTFNLISAPVGRVSFVSGNGVGQAYYMAFDGTSWEKGYGTVVSGSPDTLSRDSVIRNSSGTQPGKISFSSTVTIISDIPAERAIFASADNSTVSFGGRSLSGVGAGGDTGAVPRLDQVAWQQIGSRQTVSSGTPNVIFSLPSSPRRFRIEWEDVVPISGNNSMIMRLSADGTTYYTGSTDYRFNNITLLGSTLTGAFATSTCFFLSPSLPNTSVCNGSVEFMGYSDHSALYQSRGSEFASGSDFYFSGGGRLLQNGNGPMAGVLIGIFGGHGAGSYRLLGAGA